MAKQYPTAIRFDVRPRCAFLRFCARPRDQPAKPEASELILVAWPVVSSTHIFYSQCTRAATPKPVIQGEFVDANPALWLCDRAEWCLLSRSDGGMSVKRIWNTQAVLLILLLSGCSGLGTKHGSDGSPLAPEDGSNGTGMTVTPSSVTIRAGSNEAFAATINSSTTITGSSTRRSADRR